MRAEVAESGYVRARRRDVHPLLRDVAGYGGWWPGVTARPVGVGAALVLAGSGLAGRPQHILSQKILSQKILARKILAQKILVQVTKDRPDLGVTLSYVGDVRGEAEWYYLDEPAGVIVTYLLRAEVDDRGGQRRVAAHRARVRAALLALADRADEGRRVAAEPPAQLRRDQSAARAVFRAGVEAHAERAEGPRDAG